MPSVLLLAAGLAGCSGRRPSSPAFPAPPSARPSASRAAPAPPDRQAGGRQADDLATRSLSVDFQGVELAEALRILSRSGAARFAIEPGPDLSGREPVSLSAAGMAVAGILDWICRQADARWMREGETIWIARDLPRAAVAVRRTEGHLLRAVTAPPGGARVDGGDLAVRTVYDPGRRGEKDQEDAAGSGEAAPPFDAEASAEGFLAIAREAIAPLVPEPRLTRTREGFLADLPDRGHERLAALLAAFERIRSADPRAFDADGEARLARAAARPVPDLSGALAEDLAAGDAASAFRTLARRSGVPVGWDARAEVLHRPEAVSLACAGKTLAWALDRLAESTAWRHRRVEPGRGVWLSTVPIDPAEGDREHPWDRCVVGAWRLPGEWLARRGADGIVAAVRAELSPAPTRGSGRILAVHETTGILLAVQEPEAAARIPGILDRFRKGLWPGWKRDGE